MSIDLSKAKPGMIVKFACGGEATIEGVGAGGFKFKHYSMVQHYLSDGRVYPNGSSLCDIVGLEEPPFDWKDVKPGMAFATHASHYAEFIFLFVGWNVTSEYRNHAVFQSVKRFNRDYAAGFYQYTRDEVFRVPEHDVLGAP